MGMTAPLTTTGFQATSDVWYPDSDGTPLGETDFHISVILYLRQALRCFLRGRGDMYVAANMFLYYEEGERSSVVAPDVFVVRGVPTHDRNSFKLWEEGGTAPCTVFEITSKSSRIEDLGNKKALYEMLGVREYFLFDPLSDYLEPRLRGCRLASGEYRSISPRPDGSLDSTETGLRLEPRDAALRLVDPISGALIPTLEESMMIAENEAARAEKEAKRAESEAKRAENEAARADSAETELARLRTEIERLRSLG